MDRAWMEERTMRRTITVKVILFREILASNCSYFIIQKEILFKLSTWPFHILWLGLVTCNTAGHWLAECELVRTDDSDGDHPLALSRSVTPSKDGADNPRDRDSSLTSVTECDNTFTHSDLHNAPESNKFNKNILFCWRHDPARRELMGDFYDSKTRITNGAFTLALSSQPLNWALFMIDLTELNFYCSNFLRKKITFIELYLEDPL